MLDRTEIEADLVRRDPEEIESAFDALVCWHASSVIAGIADAGELMDLFERVCAALRDDENAVPPETARALAQSRGPVQAGTPRTYGAASRLALAAHRSWWPAFTASFPDGEAG